MTFTDEQLKQFAKAVPFAAHLGFQIKEISADRVVCTVTTKPEHSSTPHSVHGGFLMALADYTGACGAHFNLPEGSAATTTTESKTNMIRPGRPGTRLTATAVPINIGRLLQVWQTEIRGEDGKLVSLTIQTQINL